jgi:penicillin-binding protein 2A
MFELQREEAQKELDEAHENIQYLIELLDSNNQEKARRRINFKPKKKKEVPKKKKEVPKKKKDKSKKKKDKSKKKKDKSNKK